MLPKLTRWTPLALVLALAACQDSSPTALEESDATMRPAGAGKGFTLLLTDAPGDLEAAVVTISQVTLQGSGQPIELLDAPFTGDLLDLRNEFAALVRGFDLPAGSYSQLRVIIDGAYIEAETENGTTICASSPDYEGLPAGVSADCTLHMPSMGTSGLKINLPGGRLDIGEGETIVMLDFDASKSFGHQAGRSGRWVMHPVIKATNVTFGGNLLARIQLGSGIVLPVIGTDTIRLSSFTALLTPAGGGTPVPVTFSDANGDGIYEALFKGIAPGTYTLSLTGPAGLITTFSPTLPLTVTVGERQTTTQLITLASAALPGTVVATLRLGTGVTLPSIGTPPAPVTLTQFRAQVTAANGTITGVTFSDANSDGTFEAAFPNLAPGTYSLTLLKPAGITPTYDVAIPVNVTVAAGATETRPFVITAVTAP